MYEGFWMVYRAVWYQKQIYSEVPVPSFVSKKCKILITYT